MSQAYFTDKDAAQRFGVSRITIHRWVRDGDFPKPVKFSSCCTRWAADDLELWETSKRKPLDRATKVDVQPISHS